MLSPPVSQTDHMLVDKHTPITLVESGDYQCSFCALAQDTITRPLGEFNDRFRFVFRNFPLEQIHPQAINAALVAEAAGPDDFWSLHDLLYASQDALDDESLLLYATHAGVSEEKVRAALAGAPLAKIQRDVDSGGLSGVQGIPAFFVTGHFHEGEWRGHALAKVLRQTAELHRLG